MASAAPSLSPPPPQPLEPVRPRAWQDRFIILWILICAALAATQLSHPLDRKFDWNTAFWSIASRHLNTEGFAHMRAGVYITAGDLPREQQDFYAGHPPLTAWLGALWMRAFGSSDASLRALPALFTLANILLMYLLGRKLFAPSVGLAAAVLYSLMPMTAYYGLVINMEPFVLTFILAASIAYAWWETCQCAGALLALLVAIAVGCGFDWPMFVFSGALAGLHVTSKRPYPWRTTVALLLLPVLMFILFAVYLHLNGAEVKDLTERAQVRMGATSLEDHTGAASGSGLSYGYAQLWRHLTDYPTLYGWFISLFTPVILSLSFVGLLIWRIWTPRLASAPNSPRIATRILIASILTQFIFTLAFAEGASRHEYWQYYLTLPIALLAAGPFVWLATFASRATEIFTPDGSKAAAPSARRFRLTPRAASAAVCILIVGAVFAFSCRAIHYRNVQYVTPRYRMDYAAPLQQVAGPADRVYINQPEVGYTLSWYANRWMNEIQTPEELEAALHTALNSDSSGKVVIVLVPEHELQPAASAAAEAAALKAYGPANVLGPMRYIVIPREKLMARPAQYFLATQPAPH